MSDTADPMNRGKASPDVDSAAAAPNAPGHDESSIDESIEESFAASDPPSSSQPGSTAALRSARDRQGTKLTASTGMAVAGAALVGIALYLLMRR